MVLFSSNVLLLKILLQLLCMEASLMPPLDPFMIFSLMKALGWVHGASCFIVSQVGIVRYPFYLVYYWRYIIIFSPSRNLRCVYPRACNQYVWSACLLPNWTCCVLGVDGCHGCAFIKVRIDFVINLYLAKLQIRVTV